MRRNGSALNRYLFQRNLQTRGYLVEISRNSMILCDGRFIHAESAKCAHVIPCPNPLVERVSEISGRGTIKSSERSITFFSERIKEIE